MFILKLQLEDSVLIYINNIYSKSLLNMPQESVLYVTGQNSDLDNTAKIVGT